MTGPKDKTQSYISIQSCISIQADKDYESPVSNNSPQGPQLTSKVLLNKNAFCFYTGVPCIKPRAIALQTPYDEPPWTHAELVCPSTFMLMIFKNENIVIERSF